MHVDPAQAATVSTSTCSPTGSAKISSRLRPAKLGARRAQVRAPPKIFRNAAVGERPGISPPTQRLPGSLRGV
jgi:hypothetical protein